MKSIARIPIVSNRIQPDRTTSTATTLITINDNMADSQFEPFREFFDKLPQHIKAPSYCYRLAHDITLENIVSDEGATNELYADNLCHHFSNSSNNGVYSDEQASHLAGKFGDLATEYSNKDDQDGDGSSVASGHSNAGSTSKNIWADHRGKGSRVTTPWPAKAFLPAQATLPPPPPQQATCLPSGRKRRRLPEIPKDKPAFCTSSIIFKTRGMSLAEELCEAEKSDSPSPTPTPPPPGDSARSSHDDSATGNTLGPVKMKRHQRRLFPFRKCHRYFDDDSSPEEKILNTDIDDSGNSTAHSPDGGPKSFSPAINGSCSPSSPASSSGVSTNTLESLEATHRGLHKFIPRHNDEVEIEIGDPLYVQKEADDLWCEGINLRTGKCGIFPSAYVTDVEYTDFDPDGVQVKKERFLLSFLGSIEVTCNKGNDVLCQAIRKITRTEEGLGLTPHPCILEISDQGLRMVDKTKPLPNDVPCHDYFFFLKNISFCGFHPNDYRYFGFITKHPTYQRFACHVFIGENSTRPVAEAVGRAFHRFYQKFIETAYPIEDIYLE